MKHTKLKKVMIVDDNEINRILLSKMLKGYYQVISIENGKKALEYIIESRYAIDAVLLDIIMPVMNGHEFLKARSQNDRILGIPVMVISQAETPNDEIVALQLGANDFIKKPYEPMIIRQRIANLIQLSEIVVERNKAQLVISKLKDEKLLNLQQYERQRSYLKASADGKLGYLEFNLTNGDLIEANDAVLKMLHEEENITLGAVTEKFMSEIIYEKDKVLFEPLVLNRNLIEDWQQGKSEKYIECRVLISENEQQDEYRWVGISYHYIVNPEKGRLYLIIVIQDINQQKLEECEMKNQAKKDSLTGVLNRAALERLTKQKLEHLESHNGMSAFIILDLDDFKYINDTYGHTFGDKTLKYVAGKLKSLFRSQDIVGRLGGDEFVIFMNHIPSEEIAKRKGNMICESFHDFEGNNSKFVLTCSVGIALTPTHGTTFEELYRSADKALYQAKRCGKNGCAVYEDTEAEDKVNACSDETCVKIETILHDLGNRIKNVFSQENLLLWVQSEPQGIRQYYCFKQQIKEEQTYLVKMEDIDSCEYCQQQWWSIRDAQGHLVNTIGYAYVDSCK